MRLWVYIQVHFAANVANALGSFFSTFIFCTKYISYSVHPVDISHINIISNHVCVYCVCIQLHFDVNISKMVILISL